MAGQSTGAHLRTQPFAQALRRAIDTCGQTLTWLHQRLTARGRPISIATLSSWRSGARHPESPRSLEAVAEIERILGLPENALSALIGPSRRTGRIGHPNFPWDDQSLVDAAVEMHELFGVEFPPPIRELTTHSVAEVGGNGGIAVRHMRFLLQSTSGVVTVLPLLEITPWRAIPAPTFRVVTGGRAVRFESHASGRVHGVLIELDQPLTPASTGMLEVDVIFSDDGPPVHETGHGVGRSIHELLLWIRFPSAVLPDWCNVVDEATGEPLAVTPLLLDRGGSGHVVRRGYGPGAVGIHWGYDGVEPAVPFARD